MDLSKEDIFVIETIALYISLDKQEKEGIITKEIFNEMYDKFTPIQARIVSYYITFETTILTNLVLFLEKITTTKRDRMK